MELVLVLHNIRSTYNVGSILRTADGFGISEVIFSGYTPKLNDSSLLPYLREKLDKQIAKTALGAEKYVMSRAASDIISELKKYKKEGFVIAGLENNIVDSRLIKIDEFGQLLQRKMKENRQKFSEVSSALRSRVVLVLGEEVNGIDRALYDEIDVFLEIPMKGHKESFNVSVATGVACYVLTSLN